MSLTASPDDCDDRKDNQEDVDSFLDDLPVLPSLNEHERDAARKRAARHDLARIEIPPCKNPARRAACLADPELFLKTYFTERFYHPFVSHHREMINAIITCARDGGDQAVAAPRADGKSQIAVHMLAYVILKGYTRFPVIVASTRKLAGGIFKQFKGFWRKNKLLREDFPEICIPVLELDGAPQRALKQHIDGEKTEIVWTADEIRFPIVPGSPYGGVCMMYFGLDAAIRGVNDEGARPDFVLIDDPETREVADNDEQNGKVEQMIDSDIAGLGAGDSQIARVVLTTIQNSHCYSARVTNPKIKPSFNGKRYSMMAVWPKCWDTTDETVTRHYWHEYIALRQRDQSAGDKNGTTATKFYLDNQAAMDEGAVISNPHRFSRKLTPDGQPIEHTAIQAFFNRVADWGLARVLAELQNAPEEDEQTQTVGLTAGLVAGRLSGFQQNERPPSAIAVTVGLDLGDRYCHWVKVAWWGRAIGCVMDYGILETHLGTQLNASTQAIQHALLNAFPGWRTDILAENPPILALVDSGDGQHSDAVYQFCREAGPPFFPSKGWDRNRFHLGNNNQDGSRQVFLEAYAQVQNPKTPNAFWLYNVNTEYWKQWLQERFLTKTFDESQLHNDGSLSLFSPPKSKSDNRLHFSFSQHIVAEERRVIFVPGKGQKVEWYKRNKNNHYLDALALACAAGGCVGISLVRSPEDDPPVSPAPTRPAPRNPFTGENTGGLFTNQYGQAFLATRR